MKRILERDFILSSPITIAKFMDLANRCSQDNS